MASSNTYFVEGTKNLYDGVKVITNGNVSTSKNTIGYTVTAGNTKEVASSAGLVEVSLNEIMGATKNSTDGAQTVYSAAGMNVKGSGGEYGIVQALAASDNTVTAANGDKFYVLAVDKTSNTKTNQLRDTGNDFKLRGFWTPAETTEVATPPPATNSNSGNGGGYTPPAYAGSVSVSYQTTTKTDRVDNLVSTEVIPFMRPIDIKIEAQKIRPYSKLKVFFDGTDVTKFSRPVGGAAGDDIVADSKGNAIAIFSVPPYLFKTGNRSIVVSDDTDPANATSIAEATFVSGGTLEVYQATVTTTNTTRKIVKYYSDPLAQTFFIDTKTDSPGVFVTSVDLYFNTKDPVEPVEVEFRPVVGGIPGDVVIGRAIVQSNDVNLSEDSRAATKFEFPFPLYVENKAQYAIVIKSNSTMYNAWIATMGMARVDTQDAVSKQPNAGVMLVSSNDSTWTPVQLSDVKFRINVANFATTPVIASMGFEYPQFRTAFNCLVEVKVGENKVRVFALNHGLQIGSKTRVKVELDTSMSTLGGIPVTEINDAAVVVVGIDAYSFTFSTSTDATETNLIKVTSIQYEPNILVDNFMPIVADLVPPTTSIKYFYRGVSGRSVDGTQSAYLTSPSAIQIENKQTVIQNAPTMIPSYTETVDRFGGASQPRLIVNMSTSDRYVAPNFDITQAGIAATTNIFNNVTEDSIGANYWVPETSPNSGLYGYRYITRYIGLKTPATALKVRFTANCMSGNYIDVYYRTNSAGDTAALASTEWSLLPPTKPFINTNSAYDMYDYEYYDVTGLPTFDVFQVKLVMRGTNSAVPPGVKMFRAIALAV